MADEIVQIAALNCFKRVALVDLYIPSRPYMQLFPETKQAPKIQFVGKH
jgi:hypothetical protein